MCFIMDAREVSIFDRLLEEHEEECFGSLDGEKFFRIGRPSGEYRGLVGGRGAQWVDGEFAGVGRAIEVCARA